MFYGHPGHDIFPVDEIDSGNGAIGKKSKDFFVRVKVERHSKVLFFPEIVDDFDCFSAGDGDESEGRMVFQFIPHAVNLREFPLAIATGGNEENQQGCVAR